MGKKKGFLKIDIKLAEEKHESEEQKIIQEMQQNGEDSKKSVFSQINELIFISGTYWWL